MKTIASLFLLVLVSSFVYKTTCDTDQLYGKWLLVDSYDEGTVTVDSLLRTKIVSHTRVKLTYQKNGMAQNDQGDYLTWEMFTISKATCLIQHIGLTSNALRNIYMLYLDEHYLITSERGKIYFYEREEQ